MLGKISGFIGSCLSKIVQPIKNAIHDPYIDIYNEVLGKYSGGFTSKLIDTFKNADEFVERKYRDPASERFHCENILDILKADDFLIQTLKEVGISQSKGAEFIVAEAYHELEAEIDHKPCIYDGEEERYLNFILKNATVSKEKVTEYLKKMLANFEGDKSRDTSPQSKGSIRRYLEKI